MNDIPPPFRDSEDMREILSLRTRSPHLRWLEVADGVKAELLRLKYQAKLLNRVFPKDPAQFHGFEREAVTTISDLILDGMDWTVTHNSDLPRIDPTDRVILLGNHPTLTTSWVWAKFMEDHFVENLVAVGKDETLKNPLSRFFLGKLLEDANKIIPIPRGKKKHDEAIASIRTRAAKVLTPGTGVILFSDQHRAYPSRIRDEQKYWDDKRPELEVSNWMTETCFPHSGGLWALREVTKDLDSVRFLDCTTVEPFPVQQFGARVHFDVREISANSLFGDPPSQAHLNEMLIQLWKEKNERIRQIRS